MISGITIITIICHIFNNVSAPKLNQKPCTLSKPQLSLFKNALYANEMTHEGNEWSEFRQYTYSHEKGEWSLYSIERFTYDDCLRVIKSEFGIEKQGPFKTKYTQEYAVNADSIEITRTAFGRDIIRDTISVTKNYRKIYRLGDTIVEKQIDSFSGFQTKKRTVTIYDSLQRRVQHLKYSGNDLISKFRFKYQVSGTDSIVKTIDMLRDTSNYVTRTYRDLKKDGERSIMLNNKASNILTKERLVKNENRSTLYTTQYSVTGKDTVEIYKNYHDVISDENGRNLAVLIGKNGEITHLYTVKYSNRENLPADILLDTLGHKY